MVSDHSKMTEGPKQNHLRKTGQVLAKPGTSRKTYWSFINALLNKAKIPMIPPPLEKGLFITDFYRKGSII